MGTGLCASAGKALKDKGGATPLKRFEALRRGAEAFSGQ